MGERLIVEVQRIDNSGPYATRETVERKVFTDIREHDQYIGQVKQQYAEDDHVQIVGNDHTEYKSTKLGRHYIF